MPIKLEEDTVPREKGDFLEGLDNLLAWHRIRHIRIIEEEGTPLQIQYAKDVFIDDATGLLFIMGRPGSKTRKSFKQLIKICEDIMSKSEFNA
jgi:hypothetical protein